jgi:hypothetical protein
MELLEFHWGLTTPIDFIQLKMFNSNDFWRPRVFRLNNPLPPVRSYRNDKWRLWSFDVTVNNFAAFEINTARRVKKKWLRILFIHKYLQV